MPVVESGIGAFDQTKLPVKDYRAIKRRLHRLHNWSLFMPENQGKAAGRKTTWMYSRGTRRVDGWALSSCASGRRYRKTSSLDLVRDVAWGSVLAVGGILGMVRWDWLIFGGNVCRHRRRSTRRPDNFGSRGDTCEVANGRMLSRSGLSAFACRLPA